jgi:hypothetical protein
MSDPRTLKPYAAHGWVIFQTTYARGGRFTFIVKDPATYPVHLYTKGKVEIRYFDTDEVKFTHLPGAWSKGQEDFSTDKWTLVVEEGSEVWCIDPGANKGVRPPVVDFHLLKGESREVSPTDKLFLCVGTILVGDLLIEGPKQIRVQGTCNLLAVTDCHGVFVI